MKVRIVTCALLLAMTAKPAIAYTALAYPEGWPNLWSASHGASSQQKADEAAIGDCKRIARKQESEAVAKTCKVRLRAKGGGYGAATCGDDGCSFVTGNPGKQQAVDKVYADCAKRYRNCRDTGISVWLDTNFPSAKKGTAATPSKSTRYTYSCRNADCIVKYEDGRTERVRAASCFNAFNNTWEYKIGGC